MKKIESFLNSLLHSADKYPHEQDFLGSSSELADKVFARIYSKKFRNSKSDVKTVEFFKKYVQIQVERNMPIRIFSLFGAYKQFRLSSAPLTDWSEAFNISHLLEAASYIESIYKPGVEIIIRGDEGIVTIVDNYKRSDQAKYMSSYIKLVDLFRKHIPSDRNIKLAYEAMGKSADLTTLLPQAFELAKKKRHDFLQRDIKEQEYHLEKSKRNFVVRGEQDFSQASEAELREKYIDGIAFHDAYAAIDVQLAGAYLDEGVCVTYRTKVPGCLHYASCRTSNVQYWSGEGVVSQRGKEFLPSILSFTQLQAVTSELKQLRVKTLFDSINNNYSHVRVHTVL